MIGARLLTKGWKEGLKFQEFAETEFWRVGMIWSCYHGGIKPKEVDLVFFLSFDSL